MINMKWTTPLTAERAELLVKIQQLENKSTRTPEEETELEKLKNKLRDLDQPNSETPH